MYCWIESKCVTIFYNVDGKRFQQKLTIDEIGSEKANNAIMKLAQFVAKNGDGESYNGGGKGSTTQRLINMMNSFKEAVNDVKFMPLLSEIDKWMEL